jgi:hypothetical protein
VALAVVRFEGVEGGRARFRLGLGTSRWYSYAVGGGATDREHGFPILRDPEFQSPLMGPVPPEAMGRVELEVPLERFARGRRHLQVTSYLTRERHGPAVSETVAVPLGAGGLDDAPLPAINFGMGLAMQRQPQRAVSTAFSYREAPPVSSAMFLGGLMSLIPALLPAVGSLVGGLFGGGGARPAAPAAGGGGTATAAPPALLSPETMRLLMQLLQQLGAGAGGAAPAAPARAQSLSLNGRYSEQAAVPAALLAALPALMPLLQQVLSPQTIQAVLSNVNPNAILGTITNGILDLGRLGIQSHEQELAHLRALNPGVNNDAATQLLLGMSAGLAAHRSEPAYRRVESVRLAFAETRPVRAGGRERVMYRHGAALAFPLDLATPRPVPRATLRVAIKDPASLRVLAERSWPVDGAGAGRIPVVPTFAPGELAALKPGGEYLVCASLVWANGKGRRVGTSLSHLVGVTGELAFDRVEEGGEPIPLNDVVRFRDFWHRAWHTRFTGETRHREVEAAYFYTLESDRDGNARMETETRDDPADGIRQNGRMRAGMILSPVALDALLPEISEHPRLAEAELAALDAPELRERVSLAGRARLSFRGRSSEEAACWVFPEVRVHPVVLNRVAGTGPHGEVTELEERTVHFPLPAVVHFVGTRSRA